MSEFDCDLFVVGAGSGGVRASRIAAAFGARVIVAEAKELGGTCVNVGCVPKKLFVYGSHYRHDVSDAAGFGWDLDVKAIDWSTLIANKDREISRLNGIYGRLLEAKGVQIVRGWAKLVGPHEVEVAGDRYTAKHILIATGGRPWVPEIPGHELLTVSDDLFHLDAAPKRVVVIGGGYIGVEFAGVFAGYGSEVTLVHRREHVLSRFDSDIRAALTGQLEASGVALRMSRTAASLVRSRDGAIQLTLDDGSTLEADLVVSAVGRRPLTSGLGLEDVGVEVDAKGAVVVNDAFQTNVPSVYAVGDVIDRVQLTPVALAEGMTLARNLFDGQSGRVDYTNIATAVFSDPPVGTVGLTESEARAKFESVTIFRSTFTPLKHRLTGRDAKTTMKLVVDAASDRVVGCHVLGPGAGEIMQGFAVALKCGATKAQFDATIGIHPTAAEELVTMRTPVG